MSIEGEGPLSGHPTAYIRFARCNFTCGKFNNPKGSVDDNGYAPLNFDPNKIRSLNDFNPIEIGCDTQYSVNPKFRHIWKMGDETTLANEIISVLPDKQWKSKETGLPIILSLTGGEPMLSWKTIPTLLNHKMFSDLETIIIETNCAVPFKYKFISDIIEWITLGYERNLNRTVVWSNSPKLSSSGEPWNKAIRPEIARLQLEISTTENHILPIQNIQYFKFVCGPNKRDFDEVKKAMTEYYKAGIPKTSKVYIMPESCTEEQQTNIAARVADMCIQYGYIYCHRIHNSVYANAIGK